MSSIFMTLAGTMLAACNAAAGVKPARTYDSSPRIVSNPGNTSCVPATINAVLVH